MSDGTKKPGAFTEWNTPEDEELWVKEAMLHGSAMSAVTAEGKRVYVPLREWMMQKQSEGETQQGS
jgi:hypothetical protein